MSESGIRLVGSPARADESGEPPGNRMIYEFERVRFDADNRLLEIEGRESRLPPRVHALLVRLIEEAGVVVSREELIDAVWPGVIVSDQSLTEAVWRLRKKLHDDATEPSFIETVPCVGFRFLPRVSRVDGQPRARTSQSSRRWWRAALPGLMRSALMLGAMMAVAALLSAS